MTGARIIRSLRALLTVPLLVNAGYGVAAAAAGSSWTANLFAVLFAAAAMAFESFVLRRLDPAGESRLRPAEAALRAYTGRRKPDYARIRELETECGPTGAPGGTKVTGLALGGMSMRESGVRLTQLNTESLIRSYFCEHGYSYPEGDGNGAQDQ